MNDTIPNTLKHHLVIEVKDGRWDAYGDPTNPLTQVLYEQLVEIGGISDSVPDGTHYFNGEQLEGLHWSFTLDAEPNS